MPQLLSLPLSRVTDANGDVVSGAKLYSYVTGTTVPTDTYTTDVLDVEHANPVVANAGGQFAAIYLDPDVIYRFVIKTSDDTAIPGLDFDPVPGTDSTVMAALAAMDTRIDVIEAQQEAIGDLVSVTNKPYIGFYDIPGDFPDQIGGTRIVYDGVTAAFSRSRFEALDTFSSDPATVHYYVDWATGDDADSGLTEALAKKTLAAPAALIKAGAAGAKYVIHIISPWIGIGSWPGVTTDSFDGRHTLIKCDAPDGICRFMTASENDLLADYAWAAHGTEGAWKSNTAEGLQTFGVMFDGNYLDPMGFPMPLTYAASAAAVQTTPGSWFKDGSFNYVHMFDGRKPDHADGWVANRGGTDWSIQMDSGTLLFDRGIEFSTYSGVAGSSVVEFRPKNVATFLTTAKIGFRGVKFYGGIGAGLGVYDADICVTEDCGFAYVGRDGVFYQSFRPTFGLGDGSTCTIYEEGNFGHSFGYSGWVGYSGTSTSDNGSTGHNAMNIVRVGCTYLHASGAVVIDVGGCDSLNYFVKAGDPGAAASRKAAFAYGTNVGDGTRQRMILIGCEGSYSDTEYAIQVDGTHPSQGAYVQYWQGDPDARLLGPIYSYPDEVLLHS